MTELMPAEPRDDDSEAASANAPLPPGQRAWFLGWPTGFVIGMLVVHSILVHGAGADPWRLGGFAMFSSPYTRYVEVTLVDDADQRLRVPPGDLWDHLRRRTAAARTLPTRAALCALAKGVSELEWSPLEASRYARLRSAVADFDEGRALTDSSSLNLEGRWLAHHSDGSDHGEAISITRVTVRIVDIAFDRATMLATRRSVSESIIYQGGSCSAP
jgi:hypothetical protein